MSLVNVLIIAWIFAIALAYVMVRRRELQAAGLGFAYVVLFSIMHLPGALLLWIEWYSRYPRPTVELGTTLSAIGLFILMIGLPLGAYAQQEWVRRFMPAQSPRPINLDSIRRLSWYLIIIGAASRVINIVVGAIPSITAVLASLFFCFTVGVMLQLYIAFRLRSLRKAVVPTVLLGCAVLYVLLFEGFLGFGVQYLLLVGGFVLCLVRFRTWFVPVAAIIFTVGAGVFVTYFRDRTVIRDAVWYGASAQERSSTVFESFANFEWFDPDNAIHLNAVDARLNQNVFVGLAAENLHRGETDYAGFDIIIASVFAIIPRVIWPNKPTVGGGGDVVAEFTGLSFAYGTSVGAGQILEFYVSFGWTSLILGMLILGAAIAFVGNMAMYSLANGRILGFARAMMAGIALVQPQGNLVEVSSSFVAALVAGIVLQLVLYRRFPEFFSAIAVATSSATVKERFV
jgi:hypothetical protein